MKQIRRHIYKEGMTTEYKQKLITSLKREEIYEDHWRDGKMIPRRKGQAKGPKPYNWLWSKEMLRDPIFNKLLANKNHVAKKQISKRITYFKDD